MRRGAPKTRHRVTIKRRLPPSEIRNRAARMARVVALERELDGDPEGASVIRDLANAIRKMRLTADVTVMVDAAP